MDSGVRNRTSYTRRFLNGPKSLRSDDAFRTPENSKRPIRSINARIGFRRRRRKTIVEWYVVIAPRKRVAKPPRALISATGAESERRRQIESDTNVRKKPGRKRTRVGVKRTGPLPAKWEIYLYLAVNYIYIRRSKIVGRLSKTTGMPPSKLLSV